MRVDVAEASAPMKRLPGEPAKDALPLQLPWSLLGHAGGPSLSLPEVVPVIPTFSVPLSPG